jgi:prepilin-type N-terminal cleavage/methylation domain-containing protein
MKKINSMQAFTLVELLVVMTIIAILATISSIYVFGNFEDSRDSVRLADIANIQTTLDVYYTDKWNYPTPDSLVEVSYSGSMVWEQWEFGSWIIREMKNFWSQIPADPKHKIPYAYSIANNASEYQIAWILESEDEEEGLWQLIWLVVPQAHAAVSRALVRWDFNNFVVKTSTWWIDSYIATPSIISAELYDGVDVVDIITDRKLVYNEFFNLPANYSEYIDSLGWFNFNVSDPLVFEWTKSELTTPAWLETFWKNLTYIYATTPTESFDIFRRILDSDNTNTVLKEFLTKNFKVRFWSFFDCRDIYDSWDRISGEYKIDPDGTWPVPEEEVYCDMETGGGGWTKKDIVDFSNWDFSAWNDISSKIEDSGTTLVNLWSSNTPVDSWYAMRQQWGNSSYKISFQDQLVQISDLEVWDEVRFSLWLRDDADTSANSWNSCVTTDCLLVPSPWYAFYNVMFGNDGLNNVNGFAETIDTLTTSDGNTWRKQLLRKKITRPLDDFFWDIGRGFWATKDIYITWVELEVFYGWYDE